MHLRGFVLFIAFPALVFAQSARLADEVSKIGDKPLSIEKAPATPRVLPEAEEIARLQAVEARRIPIQQAVLSDAITVIASAADMNFVAPMQSDFPEPVSINFTGNPYDLLQILGEQYRFNMTYRRGAWVFTRATAGSLIGKVYRLKFTNLQPVKVGQNTVVSFGKVSDTVGSNSGSSSGNSSGSGLVFESQQSKIVSDIEELLGISKSPNFTMLHNGESLPTTVLPDTRAQLPLERSKQSGRVVVIPSTNSILVVCTAEQHRDVVQPYVEAIDKKVRQIHLNAQFVSTSYSPSLIVGIDPSNFQPNLKLSQLNQTVDLNRIKSFRAPQQALLSADALSLQLNALQQDSKSRLEQTAQTIAADDTEAALAVVTEIPYVDTNTTSSVLVNGGLGPTQSTVAFRRVGVLINAKMKIFDGDDAGTPRIRMNLKITVSELAGFLPTGSTSAPETNSREYVQTVEIPSGYSLGIGGLNSDEVKDGAKKVPLLGNIPVVGYLFKSRSKSKELRSLIAYITPTMLDEGVLVKSTAALAGVSKASGDVVLPLPKDEP